MSKIKQSNYKKYVSVTVVMVVLVLALFLLVKTPTKSLQAVDPTFPIVDFVGEYKIADGEWMPIVAGKHISATIGNVYLRGYFRCFNPETKEFIGNVAAGTSIAVYLNHLNMQIAINDQIICMTGTENPRMGDAACGQVWEFFCLPDTGEEPITLILTNPHKYGNENAIDEFLESPGIYVGGIFECQRVEEGKGQRTMGLAIALAAMAILGTSVFASKIQVNNAKELGIIGAVILFAGGYYFFSSQNICLWHYNYIFNTRILCICKELYLLFVTVLIITIFTTKTNKVAKTLVKVSALLLILLYVVSIAGWVGFFDTWFWWAGFEVFVCIGLMICLFMEQYNLNKKNAYMYVISVFILISYIIDFIAVYYGWWDGTRLSMMFFLLMFVGVLFMILKVIPQSMQAVTKAKELELEQKVLQAQLQESRISVMMSQIQPHFLYNSLAVIQELCHGDPEKAETAIGNLADFLKGNMSILMSDKVVAFEDELNHTKKYLEIEYLRFEDQLQVEYDINAMEFSLPALTLQPIVENAVRYGVRKREDGGLIKISTYEQETYFVVSVEDNGSGFDIKDSYGDERVHIGIKNVRERLSHMCDGKLRIESKPGEGTTVSILVKKENGEC